MELPKNLMKNISTDLIRSITLGLTINTLNLHEKRTAIYGGPSYYVYLYYLSNERTPCVDWLACASIA